MARKVVMPPTSAPPTQEQADRIRAKFVLAQHEMDKQNLTTTNNFEKDRQGDKLAKLRQMRKEGLLQIKINKNTRTNFKAFVPAAPPPDALSAQLVIQPVAAKKLKPLGAVLGPGGRPVVEGPGGRPGLRPLIPPTSIQLDAEGVSPSLKPSSPVHAKKVSDFDINTSTSPSVPRSGSAMAWNNTKKKGEKGEQGGKAKDGKKNLPASARLGAICGAVLCIILACVVVNFMPPSKTMPHASADMVIVDLMIAIGCSMFLWEMVSLYVVRRYNKDKSNTSQDVRGSADRRQRSKSVSYSRSRSNSHSAMRVSLGGSKLAAKQADKDKFLKVM